MRPTAQDHYAAYIRSPRLVVKKPHGRYIHETLHEAKEFPAGTEFRTIKIGGHRVVVGYWGAKIPGGKHPYFAVNSVLHPVGERCRFKKRLDKMGVKLGSGQAIRLKGVAPLVGDTRKSIISPLKVLL